MMRLSALFLTLAIALPLTEGPFINTESLAIEWANKSRGKQVQRLLSEIEGATSAGKLIVLTGDFNEPSFQDWTVFAAKAKLCPIKVNYPATKRITALGLTDAWRVAHPDEVASPGWTWTPTTRPDPMVPKIDMTESTLSLSVQKASP